MITLKTFANAYLREKPNWARHLDFPIFELCRRNPGHLDQEVVFAKISLINRVYRTNIHRAGENVEWNLAKHLARNAGGVDAIFDALHKAEAFGPSSCSVATTAHERLVRIVRRKTGRVENSFCSKYLSFHCPTAVPIFDRWAYESAWRLVGGRFERGRHAGALNRDFRLFCDAIQQLMVELRSNGIRRVDLRQLDRVLYGDR